MRDLYSIQPTITPLASLPTYYSLIDEKTFWSNEYGLVIGKDLLGLIWADITNHAYWADNLLRAIKAYRIVGADKDFASIEYPMFLESQRIPNVFTTYLEEERGDINVIGNGDMRIRADFDVDLPSSYPDLKTALWGWRSIYYALTPIIYSSYFEPEKSNTQYTSINDKKYAVLQLSGYAGLLYNHTLIENVFEISRLTNQHHVEIGLSAFLAIPHGYSEDQTVDATVAISEYNASNQSVGSHNFVFSIDSTERDYTIGFNLKGNNTVVVAVNIQFPNSSLEGVSDGAKYFVYIRDFSLKDGIVPDHHIKYDDAVMLPEQPEHKLFEVEIENPLIKKYWDNLFGTNISSFTAFSENMDDSKEIITTNISNMWRAAVEANTYNLIRGVYGSALSGFAPYNSTANINYDVESIWHGANIEISETNGDKTSQRYSILSPSLFEGENFLVYSDGTPIHPNIFEVIAPESASVYTRVWGLNRQTGNIENVAQTDDLSESLALYPHKFVLLFYPDWLVMQYERMYEILKYGQRMIPPGYRFLLIPGVTSQTEYNQLMPDAGSSFPFEKNISDLIIACPSTIGIKFLVGIAGVDSTLTLEYKVTDQNSGETITAGRMDKPIKKDLLHLASYKIPIETNKYDIRRVNVYIKAYHSVFTDPMFLWYGPLLTVERKYFGTLLARSWNINI